MKKTTQGRFNSLSYVILVLFVLLSVKTSHAKVYTIDITEGAMKFAPEKLAIAPGDIVRWVNNDTSIPYHMFASVPGSYTEEEAPMEIINLKTGESVQLKFTVPGRFPYFCFIHRGMVGEIIVK